MPSFNIQMPEKVDESTQFKKNIFMKNNQVGPSYLGMTGNQGYHGNIPCIALQDDLIDSGNYGNGERDGNNDSHIVV